MFNGAKKFNQGLNDWDVSSGTNFRRMFKDAEDFTKILPHWDMSNATNILQMFNSGTGSTIYSNYYMTYLLTSATGTAISYNNYWDLVDNGYPTSGTIGFVYTDNIGNGAITAFFSENQTNYVHTIGSVTKSVNIGHQPPPDTTSPVITISAGYGDANLYVYSGLSATETSTSNVAVTFAISPSGDGNLYSEAGATVTDNSGETLSVTIGGDTVDTTTDGTYVVTYTATDSAGNSRVRTKTVTVDDSVSLKHSVIVRKNNIRHSFNSVCRAYAAFDEQGSFRLKTHEDTVGFALFDNGRIAMDTDTAGEYTLNIATSAYMDIDFVAESITNSSDERLKMNIESINDSSKLLDLQPVQYKWKRNPNGNLHYGFIAQDLQDIYPNLVEVNNSGRYSVNYIGIVPLMVDEIKRQTDEVNDLTKRLENLEDKKNDN